MANGRSSWLYAMMLLREIEMSKLFLAAFVVATLLGAAPLLTACHTTAGFGQDVSQGGHALTNSANANAPISLRLDTSFRTIGISHVGCLVNAKNGMS